MLTVCGIVLQVLYVFRFNASKLKETTFKYKILEKNIYINRFIKVKES